ncbi:alpha/beta hydrolase family protein [Nocardia alni]|uniref:alpha/beta hydrolase family protein n=1 Tax=Nocardia alni TaxID=2815723 RepID=UPI001C215855|nr:alpha/beta fold hydrolase [Nocardia alni]
MRALLFREDPQFWFETLRLLGHAAFGGSDIGEVIATAEGITPGDYDAWHDAWLGTGERIAAEATRSRAGGHRVSARDGFLRASTYYRAAEFFLHENPDDPRVSNAYERSVDCFHAFAALSDPVVEPVEIPYEGTVLRGYFYRARGSAGQCPTIVLHNGFDGSAEEMHFFGAAAGIERGYHVLTFDGPGQPSAIHRERLVLRPDWENVVGPVLDHLASRPEVDAARIALLGLSLGGMLAPRAAAFDSRIAAVVAVDGVYGASVPLHQPIPLPYAEIVRRADAATDPELDRILDTAISESPTLRWAFGHGRYVTGTGSPREFLAAYMKFNLFDGVAEKIACPTLVCKADQDLFFAGGDGIEPEPDRLYERLTCPKTFLCFTAAEGADAHCHSGAQRLALGRIYDWLDTVLSAAAA